MEARPMTCPICGGGEWCHRCGWPREQDRERIAELEAERDRLNEAVDDLRARYQWMVERAAEQKLDGYRELAQRVTAALAERDRWHREALLLGEAVERLRHGIAPEDL